MRLILIKKSILYLTLFCSCSIPVEETDKIVEVYEEPKHQLVFQKGEIKILDVQLMPKDTTLFHSHKNPTFFVSLGWQKDAGQLLNGEWGNYEPDWPAGEVDCDTSYVSRPIVHRATNGGNIKSRLIGILNIGKGKVSSCSPAEYEICNRWFRSSRILLNKGDTLISQTPEFPVVLVIVDGANYKLVENNQTEFNNKTWAYLENQYTLVNTGNTKLEMIKIEIIN